MLVVAVAAALVALVATIGADALWLAALGREIVERGSIPDGVPYATAPTSGWPNVLVLAELAFDALLGVGDRGLLLAQLVAVTAALGVLAVDMRRGGASDASAAAILLAVVIAALPALVVIRLQLFSLALFPLLVALLRAEARAPSRRIWLLVPLFALWSNVHGAVLVGLAVAVSYLALSRARELPLEAGGVLAASVLALFATPALTRTPEYYRGVLENEAARRGFGLWAPLSLTSAFDLIFIAVAVVVVALALRGRPALWELAAAAGLAFLTLRTARSGVWLLFLVAVPAARALRLRFGVAPRIALPLVLPAAVLVVFGVVSGPLDARRDDAVVREALARARGTAVLAEPLLAEQVVVAGGRVWVANPIDAFRPADQRRYLDWLQARQSGDAALAHARRVVLVEDGSDVDERLAANKAFRAAMRGDGAAMYLRVDGARPE